MTGARYTLMARASRASSDASSTAAMTGSRRGPSPRVSGSSRPPPVLQAEKPKEPLRPVGLAIAHQLRQELVAGGGPPRIRGRSPLQDEAPVQEAEDGLQRPLR